MALKSSVVFALFVIGCASAFSIGLNDPVNHCSTILEVPRDFTESLPTQELAESTFTPSGFCINVSNEFDGTISPDLRGVIRVISHDMNMEIQCYKRNSIGEPTDSSSALYYGSYVVNKGNTPSVFNPESKRNSWIGRIQNRYGSVPLDVVYTDVANSTQENLKHMIKVYRDVCDAIAGRYAILSEVCQRRLEEVETCFREPSNFLSSVAAGFKNGLGISNFGLLHKAPIWNERRLGEVNTLLQGLSDGTGDKWYDDAQVMDKWRKTLKLYESITSTINKNSKAVRGIANVAESCHVGWELVRPNLCTPPYLIEVDGASNQYKLESKLAVTESSVIYSALWLNPSPMTDNPLDNSSRSVIVKYTNNCRNMKAIGANSNLKDILDTDQLFDEFAIMSILQSIGLRVAPQVRSLSAPVVPTDWKNDERFRSESIVDEPNNQCSSKRASVRAIIEEKLDYDIYQLVQTKSLQTSVTSVDKIKLIISIGIDTIQLLRALHDIGFIHGDIHSKNVGVIVSDTNGVVEQKLVLFDFGYAKFFPKDIQHNELAEGQKLRLNPVLLSHWQLLGFRKGRRCDVERTFQMMADLLSMFCNEHELFFNKLEQLGKASIEKLTEFKQTASYFTDKYVDVDGVPKTLCDMLGYPVSLDENGDEVGNPCMHTMRTLDMALNEVRRIPHPDARPPHDTILHMLNNALETIAQ